MRLMFKSRRNTIHTSSDSSANTQATHGKSSHALRRWRRLSPAKKVAIVTAPLLILIVLGYVVNQFVMNDDKQPVTSKDTSVEKKIDVAELVAKPPTESMSVDEKIAYYDKLTLGYAQEGKYDKAVESFTTRESISTKGLKFHDYLNLAQYQHRAGSKDGALAALDKAEASLKSNTNFPEQDRTEFMKLITKLREDYAR